VDRQEAEGVVVEADGVLKARRLCGLAGSDPIGHLASHPGQSIARRASASGNDRMCGISGWFAARALSDIERRSRVQTMMSPILTRGPDGSGQWMDDQGQVGLLHTRLAIIDPVARSDQPMVDPESGVRIIFNGEIYNYRALRHTLAQEGVRLETQGDTEVILKGYVRHGPGYFNRLRGMYALVIHDPRDQSLLAVRDPFGIKPLYLAADSCSVLFSSSPAAVAIARGAVQLDPAAAVSLAVLGCVLEPLSKWKNVRALPPGVAHRWTLDGDTLRATTYVLEPAFSWEEEPSGDNASPDRLRAAVTDAVAAHFTADVPVAIFQSAGLDSTLFSTIAKALGLSPVLLTVGFDEFRNTPMDEVGGAAETARRLGFQHRVSYVTRDDFLAFRDPFLRSMESPTADGMNSALVSRFARAEGFKVALSGIGGDEIFAGYPSYQQLPKLARFAPLARNRLGRRAMNLAFRAAAGLDSRRSPKMRHLARHMATFHDSYLLRRCYFAPEELPMVLDRDVIAAGSEAFWTAYEQQTAASTGSDEAAVRVLERDVYMRNVLLKDADWTGMAQGVEIRVPFVDIPLYRSLCDRQDRCPYRKADLRRLIGILDPDYETAPRAKSGFLVPHEAWLSGSAHGGQDLLRFGSAGPRAWNRHVLKAQFGDWAIGGDSGPGHDH
jgi:asparagine synthase (glutamine-hydrolysing)